MTLTTFELWLYRLGGAAALASLLLALNGFRRAQQRAQGRVVGVGARYLRFSIFVFFTVVYFAIGYLLWKPLPLQLPDSPRLTADIAGALIFFSSLAIYVWGYRTLGAMFTASTSFGVRLMADHRLVTSGPYRFVRHPMYLAVILAGFGGLLLYRTWAMLVFALTMFGLTLRARREDQALAAELGDQWQEYIRQVPGWIPRLRR